MRVENFHLPEISPAEKSELGKLSETLKSMRNGDRVPLREVEQAARKLAIEIQNATQASLEKKTRIARKMLSINFDFTADDFMVKADRGEHEIIDRESDHALKAQYGNDRPAI